MKRIFAAVILAVMLLCLASCGIFPNYLLRINAADVIKMNISRVADGQEASFEAESKNIVKVLNEINAVLFFKAQPCGTEGEVHAYALSVETEKAGYELYINEDGSVCYNGNHYTVDFSSKATLNLSILERMIIAANTKEDTEIKPDEQIEETEPVIEKEEVDTQEFADSIIKIIEQTDLAMVNGVRYFIANADVLNQNCNILGGESEDGNIKIYFKAESTDTLTYADGSYEQSGGKKLYVNALTEDGSAFCYYLDIETGKCVMLGDGNTSNIALFETPPSTIMGHGWIITADTIVPINLETGAVNTEMIISIKDEVKAKVINNHFFENFMEGYDRKTVTLETTEANELIITVTERSSEGQPDIVTVFTYNCVDKTFNQN